MKLPQEKFFVVPGDDLTLLGMPDIRLVDILKIMCEVVGEQQADKKFDTQTILPSSGSSCKANKAQQIKTYNADVNNVNLNMPDYIRFSI